MTFKAAIDLFREGHDTLDIARMLGRQEHEVLREITQARSALLGRTYPYSPYHQPDRDRLPRTLSKRAQA